jgi:hypothetical protein
VINGTRIFGQGSNSSRSNSERRNQVFTLRGGGSTTNFTMTGKDPTIRLLKFHGEGSEDLEKHIFICENIWAAKRLRMKIPRLRS